MRLSTLSIGLALFGCSAAPPPQPPERAPALGAEAFSLFGEPLAQQVLPPEILTDREAKLAEARAAVERSPGDPDALLWLGRRLGYLGRYREAIATFSRGVRMHPEDARFYRHLGHRHITVRELDLAIADLEKAATSTTASPARRSTAAKKSTAKKSTAKKTTVKRASAAKPTAPSSSSSGEGGS